MNVSRVVGGLALIALIPGACRSFEASPGESRDGAAGEGGGLAAGAMNDPSGFGGAGEAGAPQANGGRAGDDGSGAAADEGGAPAVSPDALEGLVVWLSADDCTAGQTEGRAAHCSDSSKSKNDARQEVEFLQPTLLGNALRGHAVLKFDGFDGSDPGRPSVLLVADAPSLRFGTEDLFVAVVARWRNDPTPQFDSKEVPTYTGYGQILSKVNQDAPFLGIAMFANFPSGYAHLAAFRRLGAQLSFGDTLALSYSTGLNDNAYRLYALRRSNGNWLELRINGTVEGGVRVPPELSLTAAGQPLAIGGVTGAPLRGDLAELVIVRGPVTDAELAGVEATLQRKYGIDSTLGRP